MRRLRNILNTIFIFAALIGMLIYYKGDTQTGSTIIIVGMVCKFIETAVRLLKIGDRN